MTAPPVDLRPTQPWLFFFLLLPTNLCAGFCLVVLPYVLHQRGVSVEQTSAMLALCIAPQSLRLLWTPLLDLGLRRRSFHVGAALLATLLLPVATRLVERQDLRALTVLLVVMNVAMTTSDAALGYLSATTVAVQQRERAAGYYSAGVVCLSGLSGGAILALHEPFGALARVLPALPLTFIGDGLCAPLVALVLLSLRIREPAPVRMPLVPHLGALFRDVWRQLRSPRSWTAVLLCLAPLCVGAATNLFGTLASDFHAGVGHVTFATGLNAALGSAAGAIVGGRLAARLGSRRTYLLVAMALAGDALAMALGPATPTCYVLGCLGYAVFSGVAYGAFFSFVFEMVGPSVGAATGYGIYMCASNLALAYVTFLDGQMYRFGGRLGLLLCDAATNVAGVLLVVAVHRLARIGLPGGRARDLLAS